MISAADELRKGVLDADETFVDVAVSCDGTWQKRGYSSLNGVVTVISVDNGKCLNYRVLTKRCAECTAWSSRKGTDGYEEFMSQHECSINHDGSAGSMEAKGVVECFGSSEESSKLRYTSYIGDGDSKAFNEVVVSDPYNDITISKLECIGHIQKRVAGRLRKMCKNQTDSKGKPRR